MCKHVLTFSLSIIFIVVIASDLVTIQSIFYFYFKFQHRPPHKTEIARDHLSLMTFHINVSGISRELTNIDSYAFM